MISFANQRGKRIQKHYAHSSSGYSQGTADVSQHPAPVFQQKTAYKLNLKSGPGVTSDPVESCFFNGRQIRQKKYWKLIKIQKVQVRKSHSVQTVYRGNIPPYKSDTEALQNRHDTTAKRRTK